MRIIILIIALVLFACKVPYNKKDVYTEKASIEADEKVHPKNSLEWWYFTGHLYDSVKQKELGIEYVFFHFNPTNVKGGWMVNMAISDPEEEKFYFDYQLFPKNKTQFHGLPLNFTLSKKGMNAKMNGFGGNYNLEGNFKNHPIEFSIKTTQGKGLVLHDGVGYENYGDIARAGYYSYPRLESEGSIKIDSIDYQVSGNLWYDRQWNCSGVFDRKVAWDWFSVQFEETNSELMLYRLYHLKTEEEFFGGTYIDANGKQMELLSENIKIEELNHYTSPPSDAKYPIEWQIKIDKLAMDFNLKSAYPEQELALKFGPTNFYYWEGMCNAVGKIGEQSVKGNSYVEMTNRFRWKD